MQPITKDYFFGHAYFRNNAYSKESQSWEEVISGTWLFRNNAYYIENFRYLSIDYENRNPNANISKYHDERFTT